MKYDKVKDAFTFLDETVGPCIQGVGKNADGNEDKKLVAFTEATIVEMFESYLYRDADNYFLINDAEEVLAFNGKYFETHQSYWLQTLIKKVMARHNVGMVYRVNSHKKITNECILGMKSSEELRYKPDRRYAIFDNCVLNLKTGEQVGFSIDYKSDIVLDFEYDPNASFPLWENVIVQTIPNEEMRDVFQKFCGALLTDRNEYKIEFICYLIGAGRNGKSVITKAIADVFGRKLVSCYNPEDLFKGSNAMYNRADVNGKLANFSDDVSSKDYSGGDFKQFISGAEFPARKLYGDPFMMTRVPFMICCVNEMPPTTDDTMGHHRRTLPIICPNIIKDEDVDVQLPAKLATTEARTAIFNWIYEGYKKLIETNGKIKLGKTVKETQAQIMAESNSARRWLRDMRYTVANKPSGDDSWRSMKDLMKEYQDYCKDFSENPKTAKSVGKLLNELGFIKEHRRDGTWYCIGNKEGGIEGPRFADMDDSQLPF